MRAFLPILILLTLAIAACDQSTPIAPDSDDTSLDAVEASAKTVFPGRFRAVATGDNFSCGITWQGRAFCWGDNTVGQLGNPEINESFGFQADAPVPVAINKRFASITAGHYHACALTGAGRAYCWGQGDKGQLGAPPPDECTRSGYPYRCSRTPIAVDGGIRFREVDAGVQLTCGVAAGGDAYCWGENRYGQLGEESADLCGEWDCSLSPLLVSGDIAFRSVSAGLWHACGLDRRGNAYCWGLNWYTYGDGHFSSEPNWAPTPAASGMILSQIHSGALWTCALDRRGRAFCWGRGNHSGDFGNGGVGDAPVPVPVAGGLRFSSLSVPTENSELATTCGVSRGGRLWCWGEHRYGELGHDASETCSHLSIVYPCSKVPEPVTGGLRARSVSAGNDHVCALTRSGEAYCWGRNSHGQVGGPVTELCLDEPCSTYPVPVSAPMTPTLAAVAARQAFPGAMISPVIPNDETQIIRDPGY